MSKEKTRLIIIESSIGLTGAFKSILIYVGQLKDDLDVIFLIPTKSSLKETIDENGLKYVEYPFIPISKSLKTLLLPFYLVYQYYLIRRLIKQNTIVHSNDLINMLGIFAKMFSPSIHLIYHIRLMPDSYISGIYPYLKKVIEWKSDRIIAVSQGAADPFKRNIKILSNSFDPIFLQFQHENLLQDPIRFLYLANYTKGKGHEIALSAFRLLSKEFGNVQIEFVGDTFGHHPNITFKAELVKYAQDQSIDRYVTFSDISKNVIEKYLGSSVFLNFSNSESFSRTVLEAMVLGMPVIATKSGGPQELIEHNKDGMLIEIENVQEAYDSMFLLVKNEKLRLSLGKNARLNVLEKYSTQKGVAVLKSIYDDLKAK